jgi:ADP-ribose pyrophosphatase YjhB (NUDIX family)
MSDDALRPRAGCGAVILDPAGRLLLGKRRRMPEAGCWGLLGGKIDWMETAEAAIVREVREESSLEVRVVRLLCVVDHFEPDMAPPQHWLSPVFLAEIVSGEPRVVEPDAIEALGWFARTELPEPLTKAVPRALAFLR